MMLSLSSSLYQLLTCVMVTSAARVQLFEAFLHFFIHVSQTQEAMDDDTQAIIVFLVLTEGSGFVKLQIKIHISLNNVEQEVKTSDLRSDFACLHQLFRVLTLKGNLTTSQCIYGFCHFHGCNHVL